MDCTDFRRHHLAYLDDTLPGDVLVAAERHRIECAACGAHDTLVRRSLLLARNLPSIEPSADFTARLDARLRAVRAEASNADAAPSWSDTRWSDARSMDAPWSEGRWSEGRWYERLVLDAGGWGRQAMAAAVVLAAVSAGYALRGGREAVSAMTAGGMTNAPAPAAVTAPVASSASVDAAALGSAEVAATPAGIAAVGAAARAVVARGARAVRRRDADQLAAARDSDDLNAPAYIPLPAGALEASALLGPASAGIPVWPAALLAGEASMQFRAAGRGGASVRLVGLSH